MKSKFARMLSVALAMALQVAPMVRAFVTEGLGLAPSTWCYLLRLGVGATALLGFDATSSASSISISPANATAGQSYVGTVTYSGGHSGSVSSMNITNVCMGSATKFLDGLTIVYSGVNRATVSGTPTNAGNFAFAIRLFWVATQ